MGKKLSKQKKVKKTVNHFVDLDADIFLLKVILFCMISILVPFSLGMLLAYLL